MTARPRFAVHPWTLPVHEPEIGTAAEVESIFALANGHMGLRGTLDEGEPRARPGTYLNGVFEERPLPHAEGGYGYPESGQTVVGVTDGKLIRLTVEDSPFDMRYGEVTAHERVLDLRTGLLSRRTEWTSPNGRSIRVESQRLVSFTHRTIAAIYEVTPLDRDIYVAVQSDLLAKEPVDDPYPGGPRAAAVPRRSRPSSPPATTGGPCWCIRRSAAGCGWWPGWTTWSRPPSGRRCRWRRPATWPGSPSPPGYRSAPACGSSSSWPTAGPACVRRRPCGTRSRAPGHGRAHGLGEPGRPAAGVPRRVLGPGRSRARRRPGTPAGRPVRPVPRPPGGRAGGAAGHPGQGAHRAPGYDGHAFWDTETYVLPVLTYTLPDPVRDALAWRHSTIDLARARARVRVLGQRGAAFPWRTIRGEECSGYWPAGTAAFHVGADIANATARYLAATEDADFEERYGAELLIETAWLWMSLGQFDGADFRIDGVTGPDEYTAVVDDNIYTNLMAQRNLREAAAVAERQPAVAGRLRVDLDEIAGWRHAAETVVVPYDDKVGVHPQSEGFTQHAEWDFARTPPGKYPLLLHYPYFDLYRKQVVKQADLVLAMHLRGDAFTPEEKARNFAYYEARTVRDSSLSACPQGVIAAEVGHLDLAYDYWGETALTDLHDLHHNTGSGLHIAALAGAWTVAVAGFGGMRDHDGRLTFAPGCPGLSPGCGSISRSGDGASGSRSIGTRRATCCSPATRCRSPTTESRSPRRLRFL